MTLTHYGLFYDRPNTDSACCNRSAARSPSRSSNAANANRVSSIASANCAFDAVLDSFFFINPPKILGVFDLVGVGMSTGGKLNESAGRDELDKSEVVEYAGGGPSAISVPSSS